MKKTTFKIEKMDCPSEEQIIRMKLTEHTAIHSLNFDIPNRTLVIYHREDSKKILDTLEKLQFNTQFINEQITNSDLEPKPIHNQLKLLQIVFIINLVFFIIEASAGHLIQSLGLVADGLDMLADSIVYGIAMIAVGKSTEFKKRVANTAGFMQLSFAIIGFFEVLRRFFNPENTPDPEWMIGVSMAALVANATCLWLLQKNNSNESHMKASVIFTSNDVIANLGVVVAGILVYVFDSPLPDLIIGCIVFYLVTKGAITIFKIH